MDLEDRVRRLEDVLVAEARAAYWRGVLVGALGSVPSSALIAVAVTLLLLRGR